MVSRTPIDLEKQAAEIARLADDLERLNCRFEEAKQAAGIASDADLEVKESDMTPEAAAALAESKAKAEAAGRCAARALSGSGVPPDSPPR